MEGGKEIKIERVEEGDDNYLKEIGWNSKGERHGAEEGTPVVAEINGDLPPGGDPGQIRSLGVSKDGMGLENGTDTPPEPEVSKELSSSEKDKLAKNSREDNEEKTDPSDCKNSLIIEIAPIYSKEGKVTYSLLMAESLDIKNNNVQKTFEDCVKVIRDIGRNWNRAHGREGLEEAAHNDDHSFTPNYENTATGAEDDISIATNASTGTRPSSSTSQEASNPIQLNKTGNISAKAGTSFTANLRKSLRIKKTPPRYSEYYDDDYEEYIPSKKRSKKLRGIGSNHQNTGTGQMAQASSSKTTRISFSGQGKAEQEQEAINLCKSCDKRFPTKFLYDYHVTRNKKSCPLCEYQFCSVAQLKLHHQQVHKGTDSDLERALGIQMVCDKVVKNMQFPKNSSKEPFPVDGDVQRHMETHKSKGTKDKTPFQCQFCRKKFIRQTNFLRHQPFCQNSKSETNFKAKCHICGRLFKKPRWLINHLKKVHGD